MKKFTLLFLCLLMAGCAAPPRADYVLVEKSQNRMTLFQEGKPLKSYDVSLGLNPIGHKQRRGDLRTPEGLYWLTYKNYNSKYYKSLRISYPSEQDILAAQARGDDPGSDIVLHGMPNEVGNYLGPITPKNWTEGCIAVRNHEMDELFRLIEVDTPIEIRP